MNREVKVSLVDLKRSLTRVSLGFDDNNRSDDKREVEKEMRLWGAWLATASLLVLCIECTDAFIAGTSLAQRPRQLLLPLRAAKQLQQPQPQNAAKQQLQRLQKAAIGELCTSIACARGASMCSTTIDGAFTGGKALAYAATTAHSTTALLPRLMRKTQAVMRMHQLVVTALCRWQLSHTPHACSPVLSCLASG